MNKVVVIPTYWGEIDEDHDVILDHPTPLKSEGTLSRLLENLITFDEMKDIPVYIIGVSNRSDLNNKVEKHLEKYLKPYKNRLNIELFSYTFLEECRNKLSENKELSYLFNLGNYSRIRNFSLLPVIMNDFEYAIFLDDDEIIEDPQYFKKAFQHFDKNMSLDGKAGYYINQEDYKLNESDVPSWQKPSWNKVKHMNHTFEKLIENDKRLLKSSIALGGNMVLKSNVMKNICYDINIPRGEDIDYLINSKLYGYNILFDNQLKIKHLPPSYKNEEWKSARQDFIRFKKAKVKLNHVEKHKDLKQVTISDLQTYPGAFMDDNLETKGKEYMVKLGNFYKSQNMIHEFNKTKENIDILEDSSIEEKDFIALYKNQINDWKKAIELLTN